MNNTKTLVAMALGAAIFAIGLIGGFVLETDFSTHTSNQNNPSTLESLSVRSYTPRLLTEYAVEFNLENSGTGDIQITDVKLNGYSNQTTSGTDQGWNGTTLLTPGQSGVLYVYAPCYTQVIDQTMPLLQANPTQTELENLETWMYSYNSTFTFVTDTGKQYNCTIPGLGFGLCYATTTWATLSTLFSFMGSSSLTITNTTFSGVSGAAGNQIVLAIKNTGTKQVTVGQVKVNNIIVIIDPASNTTYSAGAIGTITLDPNPITTALWSNGNPYAINLYDGSGNGVGSTQQTAPGA